MYVGGTYVMVYVWRSKENLVESIFTFHVMCVPWIEIKTLGLGGKRPTEASH